MTLTVASTADLVAMIEAGGNEIPDDLMFDCIMAGHEENKKMVKFIQGIVDEIGKPKFEYESSDPDPAIMAEIEEFCIEDVKKALDTDDKLVRDEALLPIYAAVHEKFDERFEGNEAKLDEIMYLVPKHVVRAWLRMSISVLTAEELTISVRLTLRLIFLQEHTVQVCSQERTNTGSFCYNAWSDERLPAS